MPRPIILLIILLIITTTINRIGNGTRARTRPAVLFLAATDDLAVSGHLGAAVNFRGSPGPAGWPVASRA